jgi:hypothetical protein
MCISKMIELIESKQQEAREELRKNQIREREELLKPFLDKAFELLKQGDFQNCENLLRQALQKCQSREDKIYLFGWGAAPGSPAGIAFLADYSIISIRSKNKLDFPFKLLNFIESNIQTGVYLSEVWFALYQEALEQRNYKIASIAYRRCLDCQYNEFGSYRIDKDQLVNRAKNIRDNYRDDINRLAELEYFIQLLK